MNGSIKSNIAFWLDKIITRNMKAAVIPPMAISKKLSSRR